MPSRAATKTVFSPAIVPATSSSAALSIASASGAAKPAGVAITSSWPAAFIPLTQRRSAEASCSSRSRSAGARQRVDEPAVAVSHLHEPELGDVARDRRLHRVEALLAQRRRHLRLRRELLLLDEPQDRALPLVLRRHASTSRRSSIAVVGLLRRDRQRRRDPQRRLARGADEQAVLERRGRDRERRAAELDREQQAGAADVLERRLEARADLAHVREQVVVDRVDHGAGRGAGDGVAAEGRGVVARDEAARLAVGDEQRADRQAVREPLRERDRVGPHARVLPGEERAGAADPGLHLVEDEHRLELVGERARPLERLVRRAAARRPRPGSARGRSRPCRAPTASASVSGVAKRTPGTSGSNGARFAGWPVIESAPIVRPWNEPSSATSPVRPVALRAHLIAASTASVPELQ